MALLSIWNPPESRHSNIKELGEQLANAFQREPFRGIWPEASIIMGHGGPGFIEVGHGQWGSSETDCIYNENAALWEPELARMAAPSVWIQARHTSYPKSEIHRGLSLRSCSVAALDAGRKLLQRIADVANARVHAATGLLYASTSGSYLEPRSNYAWAVPSNSSADRCPESYWRGPYDYLSSASTLFFSKSTEFDPNLEQAPSEITIRDLRNSKEWKLPPEIAARIGGMLFSDGPYKDDGGIAGAASLEIVVTFSALAPTTGKIIADRVFATDSGEIYFVPPSLRRLLETLEN